MKIISYLKNVFSKFLNRLKPRRTFRWIFSAVCWAIILIYLAFGIYFGIQIYKDKNTGSQIKTSTYFYPYPAAIVNGKIIWANSYYKQLSYIQQFSAKTKQSFASDQDLRTKIIAQLAENEILEFQALRYNLRVSSKETDDAYQKIVTQAGGQTEIKKVLYDLYGMSEREFKNLVYEQVLKEKIQNNLIVQVQVAHIFIKDESRAKDVATRAQKGENFADLAKQYSEDTKSNAQGGELGYLARGQLTIENNPMPEFDQAVFAAKVSDVVGPIKTSAGFEIVKIEARKGVIDDSFNNWLATLKKQAHIWQFIK